MLIDLTNIMFLFSFNVLFSILSIYVNLGPYFLFVKLAHGFFCQKLKMVVDNWYWILTILSLNFFLQRLRVKRKLIILPRIFNISSHLINNDLCSSFVLLFSEFIGCVSYFIWFALDHALDRCLPLYIVI